MGITRIPTAVTTGSSLTPRPHFVPGYKLSQWKSLALSIGGQGSQVTMHRCPSVSPSSPQVTPWLSIQGGITVPLECMFKMCRERKGSRTEPSTCFQAIKSDGKDHVGGIVRKSLEGPQGPWVWFCFVSKQKQLHHMCRLQQLYFPIPVLLCSLQTIFAWKHYGVWFRASSTTTKASLRDSGMRLRQTVWVTSHRPYQPKLAMWVKGLGLDLWIWTSEAQLSVSLTILTNYLNICTMWPSENDLNTQE